MYSRALPFRALVLPGLTLALLAACTLRPAVQPSTNGAPADTPEPPAGGEALSDAAEAKPAIADLTLLPSAPEPPAITVRPLPTAAELARGTAELRRALELRASGHPAAAAKALASAGQTIPLLGDWADLLAAEQLARLGDTLAVRQTLSAVDRDRAREWGWRVREAAYLAARDPAGAIRTLRVDAEEITDPVRRAEAFRRLGDLNRQQSAPAAAIAAYRQAMEAAPASLAAREAAAAMSALDRTAADRLIEARVWLRHGNVERGIGGLDAFLNAGGAAPAVQAEIRLDAGRALFNARRYRDAERYLLAGAREPGAPPRVAAEALFLAGRSQFRDGRTELARSTFLGTAERFPTEQAAAQALFVLGDLEQDAGRISAAREHFRRAAAARSEAAEAAMAAVRHAGILLLAGEPASAATLLDELNGRRADDRHSAQILYWAGRAHEAAGRSADARERFDRARQLDPVSYYGSLAAHRLGSSLEEIPLSASPRDDAATARRVEVAILRIDLLREIGLTELSTLEMEIARGELEEVPGALYLVAEAHHARGAPVAGILLGREIQRREGSWNPRLLRIVFPFPHRQLIEVEARRNGLDPFLVAGLIRQESMFNSIAVSPAGAVGLMQIMPATGRALARRAGVSSFEPAMLRRPEINVRMGTLFLSDLLQRAGNRTEAFAAYNAGPSRAARWRQFPEYRDEEIFAERIPFLETRDYVKILDFNARIYRMLYSE